MRWDRKRRRRGTTLAELLMALLLVALVGTAIVEGQKAAVKVYKGVTDAANAQILLRNTVQNIRGELDMVQFVYKGNGGTFYRERQNDSWKAIVSDPSSGIVIRKYYGRGIGDGDKSDMVSNEAAGKTLISGFKNLSYDASGNRFIIEGLTICSRTDPEKPLITLEKCVIQAMNKIHVLTNIET